MPVSVKKFIQSRKFWAFVTTFITGIFAALHDNVISQGEMQTLVLLAVGYIASVALEDGMTNHNSKAAPTNQTNVQSEVTNEPVRNP